MSMDHLHFEFDLECFIIAILIIVNDVGGTENSVVSISSIASTITITVVVPSNTAL